MARMPEPWWKRAVVYQIYPRSFADGDGDGIGDLTGLRDRLDHLAWLGVDAVWLSPIYRSPLADADALIAEAHDRGLRVLLDWVPNHTSIEHRWWRERPDFYIWRDSPGD